MHRVAVSATALAALFTRTASAQHRFFRSFDQEQGLAAPTIQAIAQDSAGFLWIGTQAGLVRYGGGEMRLWDPRAVAGPIFEVRAGPGLVVARDGRGIVYRVEAPGLVQVRGPDGGPVVEATGCWVSADGSLWITWSARAARRNPSGAWSTLHLPSLPGDPLKLVRVDGGAAFLASRHRLWRVLANDSVVPAAQVDVTQDLLVRGQDDVTSVSWVEGTLLAIRHRRGIADTVFRLAGRRPIAIAERGRTVWISFDRGLAALRPGREPEIIEARRGMPDGGPLLVDSEGSLWVGTFHGLRQFPEPETIYWNEDDGMPSSHARFITADGQVLWAATWGGLGRITETPAGWKVASAGVASVNQICHPGHGRMIATDIFSDWYERAGDGWRRLGWTPKAVLASCAASRTGVTWIASSIGLLALDSAGRLSPASAASSGLNNGDLSTVLEDSTGQVWVAQGERACVHAAVSSAAAMREDWRCATLPGAGEIYSLAIVDGAIWAGTGLGGVYSNRGGSWRRVSDSERLPARAVYAFEPSRSGGLWVLSAGAIVRVRPIPGQPDRWQELERLSGWQGLPGEDASGLAESTDGAVWLAGSSGVVRVPPEARRGAPRPPRVDLSDVLVNGRSVSERAVTDLAGADAVVELRFAALTYRDRGRLRTQLRLAPDRPWLPPSAEGPVYRLTGLRPGVYAAQVRGSLDDSTWSAPSTGFSFRVLQPWYRRPWALAGAVLLLAGTFLLWHRARTGVLIRLERQRTAIAMDLHDELGAGLGSIGILAGVASEPSMQEPERRELAERIAATASDLGGKLTDIVGALRTGRATLGLLAAELAERATQLVPGPVPELRVEFPDRWPDHEIPSTLRHDLRLIALEAIHNAVRHAAARRITLHLGSAGRHWLLRVADDGTGFTETTPRRGGGLGLPGMRRRAERNGARLTVLHPPEGGTVVEVAFEPHPHRIMM